jgi:outer membrane protein assembly factor BamA
LFVPYRHAALYDPGESIGCFCSVLRQRLENAYKDNKITLSVESWFDAEKLTHAATVIQELLAAHSHPSATVKPTYERTASSNEVTILFTIDEGPKAQPSPHLR